MLSSQPMSGAQLGSVPALQAGEELIPRGRRHGFGRSVAVGPNNQRSPLDLPWVTRFNHIHHVETSHGGKALLPGHIGALLANFRSHSLGELLELSRILECIGPKSTENDVGSHHAPP